MSVAAVRVCAILIVIAIVGGGPAGAQSIVVETGRLEQWVTAVYEHRPGTDDEWARQVHAWPYWDVEQIVARVIPGVMLGMLQGKVPDTFLLENVRALRHIERYRTDSSPRTPRRYGASSSAQPRAVT